jgi:RHS repeat-associated protein
MSWNLFLAWLRRVVGIQGKPRRSPRPVRRSAQLELERYEDRFYPNDPLGFARMPLVGTGLGFLAPLIASQAQQGGHGQAAVAPNTRQAIVPEHHDGPVTQFVVPNHTASATQNQAGNPSAGNNNASQSTGTAGNNSDQPFADPLADPLQDGLSTPATPAGGGGGGDGGQGNQNGGGDAGGGGGGGGGSTDAVPGGTATGTGLPFPGSDEGNTLANLLNVSQNGQGGQRAPVKAATAAAQATGNTSSATTSADPALAPIFANMPLPFEANAGQTDPSVNFISHGPGFGLFLQPAGATFAFARPGQTPGAATLTATTDGNGTLGTTAGSITEDVVAMSYVGANASPQVLALNQLPGHSNYFSGDSSQWISNVNQYGEAVYKNLYPGIDAVYYGTANRQLEFDFNVAPGADPTAVQLGFQGVNSLSLDPQGNLDLSVGSLDAQRTIVINNPVVYQTLNGVKTPVTAGFTLTGNNTVGFSVGSYDSTQPLVIDPSLGFSTYLGGSGNDDGYAIAADAAGNSYITGVTSSTNLPNAIGTYNSNGDAFVSKLNAIGQIVYSSYLGGSGSDQGGGIAVDPSGDVYVTGTTTSNNFPVSPGAYQMTLTGGQDAFVTKLNATGDTLLYSTYLGNLDAVGTAIAVDESGSAYVTGLTNGSFPTTTGAFQTTSGGGQDAFVTKLNATGTGLTYSSYLGGSGSDTGSGIAVDASGNAYVAGYTNSTNFSTTTGALQTSNGGGTSDAFVSKVNAAGTSLTYSTYLGGSGSDQANAIAIDPSGNAYVTGLTTSTNFPTTTGAYQTTLGSATQSVFVTKLNATGTGKVYSTYLRGSVASETDSGSGIAVNAAGNAYVAGITNSTSFPTTTGAFQTSYGGGSDDAFVTRLSTDGTALSYSNYLGGSGDDEAMGIALDPLGNAYVTGFTNSTNFPTAGSAAQSSNQGGYDAFVSKVLMAPAPPVFTAITPDTGSSSSDQITNNQNIKLKGTSAASATVTVWRAGVGILGTTTADGSGNWTYDYSGTTLPEGTYSFTATQTVSGVTSAPSAEFVVVIDLTAPTVTLIAPATTNSEGPSVQVNASDLNGLPNGTTVTIDVDKNNDGNFTDAGESGYATGTLKDGFATIKLPSLAGTGTYPMRARVTDLAGNQGTSSTVNVQVTTVGSPWSVTAQSLASDPLTGMAEQQLGDLQLTQPLNLDKSGGAQDGGAALVYNSDSVHVQPIIQATIPTDNAAGKTLPPSITATLTWNLGPSQSVTAITLNTNSTTQAPGDVLTVGVQVPAMVATSGRYPWSLQVSMNFGTPIVKTVTGYTFVDAQDSSALGIGWTLSSVDRLLSIPVDNTNNYPAGMLRLYGSGEYSFYSGTTTFTSPADDNGTLTVSGGTYTYYTPDGQQTVFNSSGYETSWTSADGQETMSYRYDGSNRLTGVTAIDGALATITYGTNVATIVAANNRTTTLSFSTGALTQIANPDGGMHIFAYDTNNHATSETFGNLVNGWGYNDGALATVTWGNSSSPSVSTLTPADVQGLGGLAMYTYAGAVQATLSDPDAHVTAWQLDGQGRPLQEVAADGGVWQWTRDANGRVTAATDPLSRTTTYALDTQGYVTQTTLPDANTQKYQYQAPFVLGTATTVFHALTTFTNELNKTTTYAYDNQGHQTSTTDALSNVTKYAYSASGLMTSVTDPLNHTTTLAYDSSRRLTTSTDALNHTTTYAYDANGNLQTTTDPLNRVTTTNYDAMNRLTALTDALNHTTSWTYSAAGLEMTSTDVLGRQTSIVYDTFNRGLPGETISAVGSQMQQDMLGNFDPDGRETIVRDANGNSTSYTYDATGHVTQTTTALGGVSKALYDQAGQLTATRDTLGRWSQYKYNSRGWLTQTADPLNDLATLAYDAAGNLTASTDALNHTTSYQYDASNRLTVTTDANAKSVTTAYDAAGNVTAVTDALNHTTSYQYDAANRQTAVTEAVGTSVQRTTTLAYDAADNLTASTDALNHTTSYVYDALNRVTATTEAVGTSVQRTTTTAYDSVGNVTAVTDALNHTTSFQYDSLNRATAVTEAVGASVQRTTTTIYDSQGDVVAVIDPLNHTSQVAYDLLERPVLTADAALDINQIQYDSAGNALMTIDPNGNQTTMVYDALDRRIQTVDAAGDVSTAVYDAASNLIAAVDPRGDRTTFAYDPVNRLTQTTDALNHLSTIAYDAADNITSTVDRLGNRTTFAYDALNRLTQTTDALNHLSTIAYDAADNLTATVDQLGDRTTFAYDALNRLTQTTDALNHLSTIAYDAADNVTATADQLGNRTTFAYDALNRLTQTTDALNHLSTIGYDAADNVTATIDQLGNRTTFAYDAVNRLTQTTNALGNLATLVYDAAGNVLATVDPRGDRTTFAYDGLNRLTQTTDAANNLSTIVYDAAGNLSATVDPRGDRTTFAYDTLNRLTQKTDALNNLTTVVYDAAGNVVATVDPRGNRTTFAFDALNRLTQTKDAVGDLSTLAYDATSNMTAVSDQLNHTSSFAYDALHRLTTTTDPLNNVTTLAYDAASNLLAVTNPRGFTTSFAYDALNRPTQTTDALNHLSTIAYDAASNVTAVTDQLNHTTTYAYDAIYQRTAVTDPLNHTSTAVYDQAGNVTRLIDALGFTTTLAYDALNRQTAVTDPGGGVTTTAYDQAGNVTASTDPLNHTTSYAFDALNRMTKTTDALNDVTTLLYDAASNNTGVIDPVGNRTTFAYDALNRLTQTTDPFNHSSTMAYDAAGRLTSTTDRLGRITNDSFDNANRLTGETWVVSGVTTNTFTYTYDGNGNMLTAVNNAGTDTFAYDALDRVTAVQEPFGLSLTYTYDAASNKTLTQDSQGGVLTSVYDAANRLTSQQFGGSGQTPTRIDEAYSARNQVTTITRYSDLAGSHKVGETDYSYDPAMRVTNIVDKNGAGGILANYTYTYDLASRVTSEIANGTTTSYGYDAINQLTSAGSTNYSFDANGNRTMTGYTTGTNNQMTNDGVWTYTYDAEGNLTQKSKGASAETVTYAYDNNNQMIGMTDRSSSGGGGTLLAQGTYIYDALQNRVEKDVYTSTSGTMTASRFGYDGANIWADLNGSNQLQSRRVFLDGVNEPAARIANGTVAYYLADREGSIRNLTDANGNLTDTITYDAFGKVTNETSTTNGDAYKYTGSRLDSESGLQEDGLRYYNPATGTWTTQDPKGLKAGPNLYDYVRNNPTNLIDPSGLAPKPMGNQATEAEWKRRREISQKLLERADELRAQREHWAVTTFFTGDTHGEITPEERKLRQKAQQVYDTNWNVDDDGTLWCGEGMTPEMMEMQRDMQELFRRDPDAEARILAAWSDPEYQRKMMAQRLASMTPGDKVQMAARRAFESERLKRHFGDRWEEMTRPEAIAAMLIGMGIAAIPVVGPAFVGGFTVGCIVIDLTDDLQEFFQRARNARSEADLEAAAEALARAITRLTVDALQAIIMHAVGKAARSPKVREFLADETGAAGLPKDIEALRQAEAAKWLERNAPKTEPLALKNGSDVGTGAGRDYVTYTGNKDGKPYVGVASAPAGQFEKPEDIINYRYSGNFEEFGGVRPTPVAGTYGTGAAAKAKARGTEQAVYQKNVDKYGEEGVANAQNPVGPNNPRKDEYMKAAGVPYDEK